MPASTDSALDLRGTLIGAANPMGGWGYYRGKQSRIEPTCWAVLALGDQAPPDRLVSAVNFLLSCRGSSGLLDEDAGQPANFAFNGLAALTLQYVAAHAVASESAQLVSAAASANRGILAALMTHAGVTVASTPAIRQDGSLRGWPWIDGTFSWVEPTSWVMLAMKAAAPADRPAAAAARLDEAERVLFDRACSAGGWNYGNSAVFNQDLRPYVPTTALALMALQDRHDHPVVRASLDWLSRNQTSEPSGMALGLTAICLRIFGRSAGDVDTRLRATATADHFLDNLHVTAMALFSLDATRHEFTALRTIS